MTVVATSEDLTIATGGEIRRAWDKITTFRQRCGSQLLRNRIDTIQAELMAELERRRLRDEEARQEGL